MQRFSRGVLSWLGWRIEGQTPAHASYVLVAAPHTSNWDLPLLLLMAWASGLRIRWLAKHSLFWGPLGWLLRTLGGVPVVRHRREQRVDASARAFSEQPELILVIPPEGTRSRTEFWRSGFYHIARAAGVPVIPTALDYEQRLGEFGCAVAADLDVGPFMDAMRAFYAGRCGRYPERFGPVRLREEQD